MLLAMNTPPSLVTPNFEKCARCLNDLSFSKTALPIYEVMSGALMWEDEKPEIPFSELGWFRAVLAYRTSIILGQPRREFESIWSALREIAPNWPGFRAERCTSTPELVEQFGAQKKKSIRALDRMDAALSGRRKPLSGGQSNV